MLFRSTPAEIIGLLDRAEAAVAVSRQVEKPNDLGGRQPLDTEEMAMGKFRRAVGGASGCHLEAIAIGGVDAGNKIACAEIET